MNPPPTTSSLHRLASLPRSVVFHLCLTDAEIVELGVQGAVVPHGLCPGTWLRHELLLCASQEPRLIAEIADLLDLKFASEIWRVRSTPIDVLSHETMLRIGRTPDAEFGGRLWALLSDERCDARCLGIFWCQTWLGQLLHSGVGGC